METIKSPFEGSSKINWAPLLKVAIIGIVTLVLLIPKFMILGLIHERKLTSEGTTLEIMKQWSTFHTLRGPILAIPYDEEVFNKKDNRYETITQYAYFLPKSLNIEGEIFPQERYRSIYKVNVYESDVKLSGAFEFPNFEKLQVKAEDAHWDKAVLSIALNDLRSITRLPEFNWGEQSLTLSPGLVNHQLGNKGISIQLPPVDKENFRGDFSCTLSLKGSQSLQFSPVGEVTEVKLQSSYPDPGFIGNFLPDPKSITNEGFTAQWKVLHFNRDFPQLWKHKNYQLTNNDFGVELVSMNDHYQKNARSAKYAILVILLTFLSFFLNEVIAKQKTHVIQYILVGFSILMFYLLLLSISEHLGFNLAYFISAAAVLIMAFLYSRTFLQKWLNSALLTFIMACSFIFIFVLLQLESYALLVGSVGLFIILALIMYFSRNINWNKE